MAVYATVADLQDRYEGTIADSLVSVLEVKLNDAELLLARRAGNLAARVAAGKCSAQEIRVVLCNMVIRVLRNPDGTRSETAGDYSRTLDQMVSSGRLFLSRDDKRLLGLPSGAVSAEMSDDSLRHLACSPHDSDRPDDAWRRWPR